VPGFEIASRLIRNAEWLVFMQDRAYERPELWLPDGWAWRRREGRSAPSYWERRGSEWWLYTLAGMRPLRMQEPVCHVSYYEADAFARWAGARLPREEEWEVVASLAAVEGNLLESGLLHPEPAPLRAAVDSVRGPAQMFGDTWEWTSSAWAPYPGYRAPSVEWGEYHGRFPVGELSLRGGSCLTPRAALRATRRQHLPPWACEQVTGVRLARTH
jgi:ergothioneine biosynthesis protein EgtB